MSEFLVSEIYRCLQGEGVSLGTPSILVRFQGCNLRCSWCDSAHTQSRNEAEPHSTAKKWSTDSLVNEIRTTGALANCEPIRHVIYTGGEPTLQPFHRIQKELGPRWTAEIETNGTTIPHLLFEDFTLSDYARFQWNVSPKGEVAGGALKPDALRHWAEISKKHRKIYFKFVIRKNHAFEDLESVLITAKAHNLSRSRLLLMSEGNGRDSQVEGAWLAEICGKQNIRYTPRLHVILYGSKRGV